LLSKQLFILQYKYFLNQLGDQKCGILKIRETETQTKN